MRIKINSLSELKKIHKGQLNDIDCIISVDWTDKYWSTGRKGAVREEDVGGVVADLLEKNRLRSLDLMLAIGGYVDMPEVVQAMKKLVENGSLESLNIIAEIDDVSNIMFFEEVLKENTALKELSIGQVSEPLLLNVQFSDMLNVFSRLLDKNCYLQKIVFSLPRAVEGVEKESANEIFRELAIKLGINIYLQEFFPNLNKKERRQIKATLMSIKEVIFSDILKSDVSSFFDNENFRKSNVLKDYFLDRYGKVIEGVLMVSNLEAIAAGVEEEQVIKDILQQSTIRNVEDLFFNAIDSDKFSDEIMLYLANKMFHIYQSIASNYQRFLENSDEEFVGEEFVGLGWSLFSGKGYLEEHEKDLAKISAEMLVIRKKSFPFLVFSYGLKLKGNDRDIEIEKMILFSLIENMGKSEEIGGFSYEKLQEYLADKENNKEAIQGFIDTISDQGEWLFKNERGFLAAMRSAVNLFGSEHLEVILEKKQMELKKVASKKDAALREENEVKKEVDGLKGYISGLKISIVDGTGKQLQLSKKEEQKIEQEEKELKNLEENLLRQQEKTQKIAKEIEAIEISIDKIKGLVSFQSLTDVEDFVRILDDEIRSLKQKPMVTDFFAAQDKSQESITLLIALINKMKQTFSKPEPSKPQKSSLIKRLFNPSNWF